MKYCHAQIKGRCLSTELLLAEVRNLIIRVCYNDLLLGVAKDHMHNIPTCNELLRMLDLKSISISTVCRWLRYLIFKYNENKRNYYTDGHERKILVKNRNEGFW